MERLTIPDKKNRRWSAQSLHRHKSGKRKCYDNLLGVEKVRGHRSHPAGDRGAEGAG